MILPSSRKEKPNGSFSFLYIKIKWPTDSLLLKERSFFHEKRTIGCPPDSLQCLVPKKNNWFFFCIGKLGGHSIFMFFKQNENKAATRFSCSFRKRRIRWSLDSYVLLEKGKSSNHWIFLTTPKKLEFLFVEENWVATLFSCSFRKRRIGRLILLIV